MSCEKQRRTMDRDLKWSTDFDRQVRQLARKYRRLYEDIASFLDTFSEGHLPGNVVRGVQGLPVKVARMQNSTSNKGKSGGFRMVYYYDDSLVLFTFITTRDSLDQMSGRRILNKLTNEGFCPC